MGGAWWRAIQGRHRVDRGARLARSSGACRRLLRNAGRTRSVRNGSWVAQQRPRDSQPKHRRPHCTLPRRSGSATAETSGSRIAATTSSSSRLRTRSSPPPKPPTHSAIQRGRHPTHSGPLTARTHTLQAGVESTTAPPPDHCMAFVIEGNSGHSSGSPALSRPARVPTKNPRPKVREISPTQHSCLRPLACQSRAKITATSQRGQEGVRVSECQ